MVKATKIMRFGKSAAGEIKPVLSFAVFVSTVLAVEMSNRVSKRDSKGILLARIIFGDILRDCKLHMFTTQSLNLCGVG